VKKLEGVYELIEVSKDGSSIFAKMKNYIKLRNLLWD
jgi:hypothetical protein